MTDRPELPVLWHFTCVHGHAGLGARGLLRPNPHPLMPALGPVVWLTDTPAPERDDVGLSIGTLVHCDRMAYRYRVDTTTAIEWQRVRHVVADDVLAVLESYADPATWWVARNGRAVLA